MSTKDNKKHETKIQKKDNRKMGIPEIWKDESKDQNQMAIWNAVLQTRLLLLVIVQHFYYYIIDKCVEIKNPDRAINSISI
jgi:hypothetical protein